MAGKPFSRSLYDSNDDAKEQVIDWLVKSSYKAWVNPDQYGIDVLAVDPYGDERQYEVEVKHNWKGDKFTFPGVHFSARKKKFAKPTSAFVMLNHERTHALVVDGITVASSPVITKSTIYTENEQFIEVPISKCRILKMEEEFND